MDNLQFGTLIYHSQIDDKGLKAFPLKSRSCHIKYYTETSLSAFDKMICTFLYKQNEYSINIDRLGFQLGFDIVNEPSLDSFYDEAEYKIFKSLIDEVKEWGLIHYHDDIVSLTSIGQLSLSTGKKYRFYEADTDYLEFTGLLDQDGNNVISYPFKKELGITNKMTQVKIIPYTEDCAESIIETQKSQLVQDLQMQVDDQYVLYQAEFPPFPYIGIVPTNLDVELYEHEDNYIIVFIHEGNYCARLNELLNEPINSKIKENKVEWALYSKIMHDENAVLTYDVLAPFEDILEINKLISDSRIVWEDNALLQLIINYCDADDWHALSRYCTPHVLERIVDEYSNYLDWSELTLRMDEKFLKETHSKHPWIPQLLVAREPVSAELVKFFLINYSFPDGKDDGEWNWEEIIPLLGIDFISQHIDDIPFELSTLTKELDEKYYDIIIAHPEAAWDWNYISTKYPIDYLLDNVTSFSSNLIYPTFLDRIFSDENYAKKGAESETLRKSVESNRTKLSFYYNVNEKPYLWSDEVISFFESLDLLKWEGGNYQRGFVFNQSLVWDNSFFSKYYKNLSQKSSFDYVAQKLTDNNAIDNYPNFSWNWDALSRNKIVYDDLDFVKMHVEQLNATIVLLNCSSNLMETYFPLLNASNLMAQDAALRLKITNSVSVDFIRKYIHCEWDWPSVTRRVYKSINISVIGNEIWRDKWDWNFLSEMLPLDNIIEYAERYDDKWNWMIILRRFKTEDLIQQRILSILLPLFAKKEESISEWTHLSGILPIDVIFSNFADYCTLWNWEKVLPRTSPDDLLKDNMLEKLQTVLANHENSAKLWEIITSRFGTKQLIDTISCYSEEKYLWNVADLYSRSDFSAKDYLDNHSENIKWETFSSSIAVNKLFEKAKSKKTRSLWLRIFKDYIDNKDYHWDFSSLSHLQNILEEPRLLQLDKNWDWIYISEHAKWINTDKEEDRLFKKFLDKFSFEKLSFRTDINLSEEVIKKYDSNYNWDWKALTENTSIQYSLAFIDEYIGKPWHWDVISTRDDLTMDFLEKHKDMDWDWYIVTSKAHYVPSVQLLKYIEDCNGKINWDAISVNSNLTLEVIREYKSDIDWDAYVENNPQFFEISDNLVKFINDYEQYISWDVLNKRVGVGITTDFLESFPLYIDWRNASLSQSLKFTVDLVKRYENKWYWNELSKNLKFKEDIPNYETVFKKKMKIVRFLERFNSVNKKPCIYHFTHLFNAIDVIKSRKILSRNRASELGLLRFDSAGSVVMCSHLAHPYSRFYFRPCTPTQYYNEALGADSKLGYWKDRWYKDYMGNWQSTPEWKTKYPKAKTLGLPKCPIPVFFRFDLEEVLSVIPEKCYYSDRNMQSNNPHIYKVIEDPDSLDVDYLYCSIHDAYLTAKQSGGFDRSVFESEKNKVKLYSQQEFLVESEFDFSKLRSYKIICYNQQYTDYLKQLFADDPISKNIISADEDMENLFENENRSICLNKQMVSYSLRSDFEDNYYFTIKGDDLSKVPFDLSSAQVLYEKPSVELRLRGIIKWEATTKPFDVYFVDPEARTKEWLIYSNSTASQTTQSKFSLENSIKESINTFSSCVDQLPIRLSKDLFYPNMINSYHGIAHTARVLLATHLLCNVIEMSEVERKACCIAAIIHDLGKMNDREGAEHGYNSMLLYEEKIKSIIDNVQLQSRTLNAIRYHSVEDKDCPEEVKQDVIWKVLKDADALDRSRFAGKGCDKSYLRLGIYQSTIGQSIIDLTSYLPGWTHDIEWNQPYIEMIDEISKYSDLDNDN